MNNFESEKKAKIKTSQIKEDGSYSVSGLPVGSAKITVQGLAARSLAALPGQGDKNDVPKQKEVHVPPKYGNTETSGLKCEVKSGSQSHDITLE